MINTFQSNLIKTANNLSKCYKKLCSPHSNNKKVRSSKNKNRYKVKFKDKDKINIR